MITRTLLSSAIAVALTSSMAQAAVVAFDDRDQFLAASTNVSTADFEGIVPPGSFSWAYYADGYENASLGFSAMGNGAGVSIYSHLIAASGSPLYYNWNSGATMQWYGNNSPLTITFDQPVTAVGFDFMGAFPGGEGVEVTFSSSVGTFSSFTEVRPDRAFLGIVSDTAFTSFTLSSSWSTMHLDNLSIGDAMVSEVPIPAAIWLFGSGLLSLASVARRRHLCS